LIAYQPYHFERFGNGRGVAPGSLYNYDTVVPLLFYGPAFQAEIFDAVVNPADFAPTLAAALDIPPPSSANGQVLAEALKER
jgi:arylsulfatase A-like enzyme